MLNNHLTAAVRSGSFRFYFPKQWRHLKQRTEKEVASGRKKSPDDAVVEVAFQRHCENELNPPLIAPSGASIVSWIKTYFGAGSENGHTTINPCASKSSMKHPNFPHKTTATNRVSPPALYPCTVVAPPPVVIPSEAAAITTFSAVAVGASQMTVTDCMPACTVTPIEFRPDNPVQGAHQALSIPFLPYQSQVGVVFL
mmetsp:Transcript_83642/g.167526  ORF Transcript_83642/g.167526 Transcript_83642/m.167526 type:complete len:198 (-) Transcript_83642:98-691(-)